MLVGRSCLMAYCPPVDSKRNILLGNAGPNTKIPTKEREKERKREKAFNSQVSSPFINHWVNAFHGTFFKIEKIRKLHFQSVRRITKNSCLFHINVIWLELIHWFDGLVSNWFNRLKFKCRASDPVKTKYFIDVELRTKRCTSYNDKIIVKLIDWGGIWIESSCYRWNPIDTDWFRKEMA